MTSLLFAEAAIEDIDRLTDFLLVSYPEAAIETGEIIVDGLQVLVSHPLIGAKNEHGLRELVISRGRSGYIALYYYDGFDNQVIVLAIKHQREQNF